MDSHVTILTPTGMAAYHINGNTIHSGLHININKKELALINDSELNMLRSKYHKTIAVMYEEVSMVGRDLFKKTEETLVNNGNNQAIWRVACYSYRRFLPNGTRQRQLHI